MKYTQRKWHAVEYAGFWNIQDTTGYGMSNLLDVEQVGKEQAEANAKLAAAAPELLESLKLVVEAYERSTEKQISRIGWDVVAQAKRLLKTLQ